MAGFNMGGSELDLGLIISLIRRISAQFAGVTIQSITFNRVENNNVFIDVLLTNGTTVPFSFPVNDDFTEVFILQSGSSNETDDGNWRVTINAQNELTFDRREASTWVSKSTVGSSVESDIFFASGVAGGLRYNDTQLNVEREVVRLSPGGTIWSLGDEEIQATFVSDVTPSVILPTTGSTTEVTVNDVSTDQETTTQLTFNFTSVNGGRVNSIVINTGGLDRTRLAVTEVANNVLIYETVTAFDFNNNNAGVAVPSGEQTINLARVARIRPNQEYRVDVFTATAGTYNGDNSGATFIPFLKYNLLEVEFTDMTHAGNIADQMETVLTEGTNITLTKTGNNIEIASSGAGSFDPSAHSVTEFNDVTDAGSGQIITSTERGNIRTLEQFQDAIGDMVTGNTETGITVTYDDTNGKLNFVVTAGGGQEPTSPHDLYLDVTSDTLAASVDTGTAVSTDVLNPTLTIPTFTENSYLQILQAEAHTQFTSINIGGLNQIGTFTINSAARIINSQSYRQYITTNQVTSALSGDTITLGGAS